MAINIEKVFRKEYKELTVGNSYEYLHSKKLAKYYNIINNENSEIFEKRDYFKTTEELFTRIIKSIHINYPDELDSLNFGIMYHPKREEDDNGIKIYCTETILTIDKFKNYTLPVKLEKPKEIQVKELNNEDLNRELIKENHKLKLDKDKLIKIVKNISPDQLSIFKAQREKSDGHIMKYAKNRLFQYSLDGKFIKSFDSISAGAKIMKCSTKLLRKNCSQDGNAYNGYLWRTSAQVDNTNDLPLKIIEKCHPDNYSIITTYTSFDNIEKLFDKSDVFKSITRGIIYNGFRWKFSGELIKVGKENGRTGVAKRIIKLNDNKEKLAEFNNLDEAMENIGIKSKGYLSNAITNKKKCKGFLWEYI